MQRDINKIDIHTLTLTGNAPLLLTKTDPPSLSPVGN
jgi:hypothetical protein